MWHPSRRKYLHVRDQVRLLVGVACGQSLGEQAFGPVELGNASYGSVARGLEEIVPGKEGVGGQVRRALFCYTGGREAGTDRGGKKAGLRADPL